MNTTRRQSVPPPLSLRVRFLGCARQLPHYRSGDFTHRRQHFLRRGECRRKSDSFSMPARGENCPGKTDLQRFPDAANRLCFLESFHIDHVMGLCFFEPLLRAQARSFIFGPGKVQGALTRSLRQLTHSHLFPVTIDELKGRKEICSLTRRRGHSFSSTREEAHGQQNFTRPKPRARQS